MFTSRVFASAAVGTDLARWVSVALLAALASACTHIQNSPTVDFAEGAVARPAIAASAAAARVPTPATGSLFRTASFRPGFEDVRARMVGDTVTIQIAENVSASQTSTSTVDRKGTNSMGVTAFPMLGGKLSGQPVARHQLQQCLLRCRRNIQREHLYRHHHHHSA